MSSLRTAGAWMAASAAVAAVGTAALFIPTPNVAAAFAGADPSASPSSSAAASPSDTPTASISPTQGPAHSTVQVLNLPSQDRGRSSRAVWVYRPAVPDGPALPVLYLLHGQFGSPRDPFDAGMQRDLDALFHSGVPPFVVAVPDGASYARADDEWGDAADRADRLESFLARQVLPAVEGSFRRDRAHRAVAGFSMGGYAAAFTAQLHADDYGQVVSMAGYFHPDDPDGVFPSSAQLWAHYPLARAWALNRTRVLLLDCTRESDPVIRGEIFRMQGALRRAGHPPGTYVSPGDHGWPWVTAQWPRVARFLGQGWGRVR